ncbi:3-oxoacyl-[acyl-carrier-protein] reductase FabG [Microbulbifer aggregans]|uniref:3-oxoacyl-[acyl-carrier-protein] reductase FabG n=1 Tax=Microbulbifer aggregans TaxID=1769779 RepID=A0A1C9W726_9GAMM|nr:SDR family oxidoreductase [Microbulbifer aggregans]AOS96939.1 3-oxoacyl-[acyl-carrier-protein] reductase FabG [Microbulbifer aggregans]
MDLHLKGKLAFVSGSTKGIGRAIAEALLDEGARVIINGRSGTQQLADSLSSKGEVLAVEGDLADAADSERMCREIDAMGQLDVLVNNMGIFNPKPFAEIEDSEWQTFFDANIMSTVRLSRHFFPKMLERQFGRIINIASEAGMRGLESMVHYSMTKGAQIVIGRGLANLTQGSGRDITVNSVLPGPTLTEGVSNWLKESAQVQGKSEEEFVAEFFKETEPTSLIQRFIKPEEIASIVTFLASPLSSAINGASIKAEGGLIKSIV